MYCFKCGAELPEGSVFCYQCGAELPQIKTTDQESGETKADGDQTEEQTASGGQDGNTSDDGQENPEERTAETHSGSASKAAQAGNADTSAPAAKSKKPLLLVVLLFAVCAIVAALAVMDILDGLESESNTAASSTESSTVATTDEDEEDGEEETAAEQTSYTYTYEIMKDDISLALSAEGEHYESYETTWSYVVLKTSDGGTTDALDKINDAISGSYVDDVTDFIVWNSDEADEAALLERVDSVTYLDTEYVCVRSYRYSMWWGSGGHGGSSVYGTFYDLSTGDEVDPFEAIEDITGLDMTDQSTLQASIAAVFSYLADDSDFDAWYFGADDISDSDVAMDLINEVLMDEDSYYLGSEGVIAVFDEYELGTIEYGYQEIVVAEL